MSYIVVVPPKRRKAIEVFTTDPADLWDLYQAIQSVTSDDTRVTIARCDEEHLGDWLANNVEPTWWERLTRKFRFYVTVMTPPAV